MQKNKTLFIIWLKLQYGVLLIHWWHFKDNVQTKAWWKSQYKFSFKRFMNAFLYIFVGYLLAQAISYLYIGFILADLYAGDAAVGYALAAGYFFAWVSAIKRNERLGEFVDGVIDAARVNLSRSFAYGMGYVAVSRVRTLKGLALTGMRENAFAVNPLIAERDNWFRHLSEKLLEDEYGF
jgi:hypothetical protein